MVTSATAVLTAHNVSKTFPGVRALDAVDLELRSGEVHALIGENGAGKSTLISVLAGAMPPSSGTFVIDGEPVQLESPIVARRLGIATIFQELAIEPWLSVAANVVLGAEPGRGLGGHLLSPRRADEIARAALARVGASDLPLRAIAGTLSTGQRQLVEIARALAVDARVLIMDEPTSSLPARDADRLLEIIRQLRDEGTAILFVSHRLEEVKRVADRVTVLREGHRVTTMPIGALSTEEMIELMTGRAVEGLFPPRSEQVGDVLLRVEGLTRAGSYSDVSFEVRAGEVVGFAGLIGAGRSEVMRGIYGAEPADAGRIELAGRELSVKSPRDALAAGIAYLPEDRKEDGLVLNLPVRDNMVMSTLGSFTRRGVVSAQKVRRASAKMVDALSIRGRTDSAVANLSGGNQQKVVLAKALISEARVLIFDEPTRGVDVGAKYEVHALIQELAADGAAVIVVSSELPEVMNVAHRIVVMSNGRVHGRYDWPKYDETRILADAFAAFTSEGVSVTMDEQPPGDGVTQHTRTPSPSSNDAQAPPAATTGVEVRAVPSAENRLRRLDARKIGLPLVVLGLVLLFSWQSDVFFTMANWQNVGLQASALACVAFGQAFVVLTAGLDLSVGSMVALASVVAAMLMGNGVLIAIAGAVAVGILVGMVNGLVVTRLRVAPFVTTLAMLSIASGLALNLSGGTPIVGLPQSFTSLAYSRVLGVPAPVIVAAVVFGVAFFVLRATRLGRNIYATGGNAEAARLSGINVKGTILATYVICSVLATFGGLILTARVASGQPSLGTELALQSVAAVVLGGVSLFGGRGGLAGVAVGVAFVTILTNGLNLMNVSSYTQLMVIGIAMIAAIAWDQYLSRKWRIRGET